ncbi:MAG: TonB-dependent receptor, partial [Bacteroidia bacterium]|nr:TonB-dependent receptor [Bacteroidia bacterium]
MKYFLTVLFFCSIHSLAAQDNIGNHKITGVILSAETLKPIEFAAVSLKTIGENKKSHAALTNEKGIFTLSGISGGKQLLKITYAEYLEYTDTFFISEDKTITIFDTIFLQPKITELSTVQIKAERNIDNIGIDKKVFSVEKSTLSTGGSAIDILRQIPAVNVDIDGNINIRGSGNITVFINGKPSGITGSNQQAILDQIPASTIESVELITNPSAKFDAEGVSGILNIVLKKNTVKGWNGNTTIGAGTNNKHNASGSFNYKNKKISSSNTLGYTQRNYRINGYTNRQNLFSGADPYINQVSQGSYNNTSGTLSGNFEYTVSKKSTLTFNYLVGLSGNKNPETANYYFLDSNEIKYRELVRKTESKSNSYNFDAGLTFRQQFRKPKQDLVVSANYSLSENKSKNMILQNTLSSLSAEVPYFLNTNTKNQFNVSVIQIDYTHPINKVSKFETGLKSTQRNLDNDIHADTFNNAFNSWNIDFGKTNRFKYSENVNALYATYANTTKYFDFQGGIRVEETTITTDQVTSGEYQNYKYIKAFPSFFIKKKILKTETQFSYSRRINRPGQWNLNPFPSYTDAYNLMRGNPRLKPELTDALELSAGKNYKQQNYSATAYFRQTTNAITRVRTIDSAGISLITPYNLGFSQNVGIELVARNQITKWWNVTSNLNIYRYLLSGTVQSNEYSGSNISYFAKIISNITINPGYSIQTSFNYNGPSLIPQGTIYSNYSLDLGFRKDLLKNKFSIAVNLSDAFNNRRFKIKSSDVNFISDSYRKRESRILNIAL